MLKILASRAHPKVCSRKNVFFPYCSIIHESSQECPHDKNASTAMMSTPSTLKHVQHIKKFKNSEETLLTVSNRRLSVSQKHNTNFPLVATNFHSFPTLQTKRPSFNRTSSEKNEFIPKKKVFEP